MIQIFTSVIWIDALYLNISMSYVMSMKYIHILFYFPVKWILLCEYFLNDYLYFNF